MSSILPAVACALRRHTDAAADLDGAAPVDPNGGLAAGT
jgi:hypothetical protein